MIIFKFLVMKQLLFLFLFMLNACSKTHNEANDDKISLAKTNYVGSGLKINGYYYTLYHFDKSFINGATFFYDNGIVLGIGGRSENTTKFEKDFISNHNPEYLLKTKSSWGLFTINNTNLYIEKWSPKSFGSVHKVFSHECEILNDSTYVLKKQYRMVNGQQTEVSYPNQTYHFVAFANKPSSDNNFIP